MIGFSGVHARLDGDVVSRRARRYSALAHVTDANKGALPALLGLYGRDGVGDKRAATGPEPSALGGEKLNDGASNPRSLINSTPSSLRCQEALTPSPI